MAKSFKRWIYHKTKAPKVIDSEYFEDHKARVKGIYRLDIKTGTVAMIYDRVQYPGRGFSMDLNKNQLVVHRYNPAESDILMIEQSGSE